jgi:hypothetical protein
MMPETLLLGGNAIKSRSYGMRGAAFQQTLARNGCNEPTAMLSIDHTGIKMWFVLMV